MAISTATRVLAEQSISLAISAAQRQDSIEAIEADIRLIEAHIASGMPSDCRAVADATLYRLRTQGRRYDDQTPDATAAA